MRRCELEPTLTSLGEGWRRKLGRSPTVSAAVPTRLTAMISRFATDTHEPTRRPQPHYHGGASSAEQEAASPQEPA